MSETLSGVSRSPPSLPPSLYLSVCLTLVSFSHSANARSIINANLIRLHGNNSYKDEETRGISQSRRFTFRDFIPREIKRDGIMQRKR